MLHPIVEQITQQIEERSRSRRTAYLQRVQIALEQGRNSAHGCSNLAHVMAAQPTDQRLIMRQGGAAHVAIISSYNDMLSAHAPLKNYPDQLKQALYRYGASAQFAAGVPAMCDGVTQGNPGMEMSLFSREVIAMSTAIALSHNMFDAALMLGVCDKIVPGLLIGALQFGHLPVIFVPAGPMTSGLSNDDKARIRQQFAKGEVGRDALLEAESQAYHGAGTCTFYGTANSNQLLMEVMGLHLPGSAFIHPNTPLRDALTARAAERVVELSAMGNEYTPIGHVIDERAIVNGIVGLLATGGSTNHTLHLVAAARAAGIVIDWTDFDDLSAVVPLLARIYPNGKADVNHFHAAGGLAFLIRELIQGGLLHEDVRTVAGNGLSHYAEEPRLLEDRLTWVPATAQTLDDKVLRPRATPFAPDGGLRLVEGNLGRGVIKISAVAAQHRKVHAPAIVFDDQEAVQRAFDAGELNRDFVAVVRFQGARANGMPELHRLTPLLGVAQDAGFHVALVTDGRMSGASGKVPAVIHLSPEVLAGGPLGRVRTGDMIELDADAGILKAHVSDEVWATRDIHAMQAEASTWGFGRELFSVFRQAAGPAEEGASVFNMYSAADHVVASSASPAPSSIKEQA